MNLLPGLVVHLRATRLGIFAAKGSITFAIQATRLEQEIDCAFHPY